jgi:hypothetical protein
MAVRCCQQGPLWCWHKRLQATLIVAQLARQREWLWLWQCGEVFMHRERRHILPTDTPITALAKNAERRSAGCSTSIPGGQRAHQCTHACGTAGRWHDSRAIFQLAESGDPTAAVCRQGRHDEPHYCMHVRVHVQVEERFSPCSTTAGPRPAALLAIPTTPTVSVLAMPGGRQHRCLVRVCVCVCRNQECAVRAYVCTVGVVQ